MIFDNTTVNTDELDTDVNLSTEPLLNTVDKINMSLDDSFNITNLSYEDDENVGIEGVISVLNFSMHRPPPLLTRHPPPATGKDDDISKLKEILDDVLIKTDHFNMKQQHEKILFGPDNKIGI